MLFALLAKCYGFTHSDVCSMTLAQAYSYLGNMKEVKKQFPDSGDVMETMKEQGIRLPKVR